MSADIPQVTASMSVVASSQRDAGTWLFPGLGCRYVGMGHDLFGHFARADQIIHEAEARLNFDIRAACLEGSGRKYVSPRQEAQLIYVVDCAYAAVLQEVGEVPTAICGHSLGNFAAAHASGAYDFATGLQLVSRVEDLLEATVDGHGHAMGVLIGLDQNSLHSLLAAAPQTYVANFNSPLQFVIGGPGAEVDGVLDRARAAGAKQARRMGPERALHTPLVADVAARFRETLPEVQWSNPVIPLISTLDGSALRTASQIEQFLGQFLAAPVRWQTAIEHALQHGGPEFTEVGPGTLLTNLMPHVVSGTRVRCASDVLSGRQAT